ncbi:N-acetylmuramoyl-L-alanine amidase [Saccharicrinis sp. FJH54]|uniref:N-acetylmuramoyl-L-alanine amidase n=1 Tax=Saccharicrinis sp. FJH54 TaxID=3344665 RepID=UPI0035D497EE
MLKISNHRFTKTKDISFISCPKNNRLFNAGQPDTIIIHYTAGRSGENSASYLARDNVKASAHIVIDRTGHIYQLVPFNTVAWHAGPSSYDGRSGYNNFSIGIEIDNAGILEPSGDKYISWFGKSYEPDEVIKAVHRNESVERYWHTYSEIQIQLVQDICELLMDTYPTITTILGHEEISPGRKQDPGPAFPLDKLRNLLLSNRDSDAPTELKSVGFVDANLLNIRELPSGEAAMVSSPLSRGTRVRIKASHDGWYQVTAEIEGWVYGEYISLE